MNKPQDHTGIIQNISLLYELALSIGHSLDLKIACDVFLKTLMARKNLDYAAVWLNHEEAATQEQGEGVQLVYANPRFRSRETQLPACHPLLLRLQQHEAFSLSATHAEFAELVTENNLNLGTFAIFALGKIGFLKLHTSVRAHPFEQWELHQLQNVLSKFTVSLQGCLDHQRLREEMHERRLAEESMRASLREKEMLLKEIHHRVKNNMQIVSSLLNLQAGYLRDPEVLTLFKESDNRIRTMALIHERLYQSNNLADIDFGEYVPSLAHHLRSSYGKLGEGVRMKLNVAPLTLGVDSAIPCGLIINELVSNAFKHAFKNNPNAEITIDFHRLGGEAPRTLVLIIRDNGVGFPAGVDFRQTKSLGLKLVVSLTRQLKGTISKNEREGTEFIITFPEHAS